MTPDTFAQRADLYLDLAGVDEETRRARARFYAKKARADAYAVYLRLVRWRRDTARVPACLSADVERVAREFRVEFHALMRLSERYREEACEMDFAREDATPPPAPCESLPASLTKRVSSGRAVDPAPGKRQAHGQSCKESARQSSCVPTSRGRRPHDTSTLASSGGPA